MKNLSALFVFLAFFLLMAGVGRAEQHDKLTPLLTELSGWQAKSAHGVSLISAHLKMISATRIYSQSDKNLTMNIMVNSGPVLDSDLQEFSSDNESLRVQSRQIDGFWVKTTHNKKNSSGQVIVHLDYNQVASGVMIVEYTNMNEDEVLETVRNIDWRKLKKVISAML